MRVTVLGAGYVGLVSGACFSDFGHVVTCVDKDAAKIAQLNAGRIPIFEPVLEAVVARNVAGGRLFFSTDAAAALRGSDVVLIAVGTPSRRGDGHADVSYVLDAAREIAAQLSAFAVIVTKSTVPVGTGDQVEEVIRKLRPAADFVVVSNPEFLREGAAIDDFKHPDRIVVGIEDERARTVMRELYRPLFINETPILFTSRRTAELIKYATNAYLATKVTFVNEIANLCEALGANVQDVARGVEHVGYVGVTVAAPRRRADRDQRHVAAAQRCGRVGREEQAAARDIARDHRLEARFEDWNAARVELSDLHRVLVDAGDDMAEIGKARPRHKADITRAENRHAHWQRSPGRATRGPLQRAI